MARKKFDADFDDERCGIVGGEMMTEACAGCDGWDWEPDPLSTAHDQMNGGGYGYLGHFGRREFVNQGHNDITMPGLSPLKVPGVGSVGAMGNMGGVSMPQNQSNRSKIRIPGLPGYAGGGGADYGGGSDEDGGDYGGGGDEV
jgi:hypothetical protein